MKGVEASWAKPQCARECERREGEKDGKAAKSADAGALAELAVRLWEGHTVRKLEAEFAELLEQDTCACFLIFRRTRKTARWDLPSVSFVLTTWRVPKPARWGIWRESMWTRTAAGGAAACASAGM